MILQGAARHPVREIILHCSATRLVLQLHICADFSMCNGSGSLVLAPPS
jgi:hypothetical protein